MKRGQSLITVQQPWLKGSVTVAFTVMQEQQEHSVRKYKPSHSSELGDSLHSDRYAPLIKPLRAALFVSFFIHFIFAPTKWLSF